MKISTCSQNKIKFIFLVCLSLIFYSCSNENKLTIEEQEYLQKNRELKVAVYPYYAPYQFINQRGEIDGIFIDFMELIEQKNNIKFKKVYYKNWDEVITDVKNDKIDIILEIQNTKERSEYLNFFEPFFESQIVLVQQKGIKKIDGLDNFGNRKMILPDKYATVEFVKTKYPKINLSLEVNDENCLKKINNGQFDAFIGPKAVINYFIKKDTLNNLAITGLIDDTYMPSFATTKKNKILTSIIKKNLESITATQKKSIINNWLFDQVSPIYQKSEFWIILTSIILGLSILLGFFSFYLKQKVKQRTTELHLAKEKAEESNKFKTNLIQNISHEIRTPMNGIIGFVELLKSNELTNENRDNYINIITKSSQELEASVNSILDISQLETKQVSIYNEFIDLSDLINDLYQKFLPLTNLKKLKFTIENNFSDKELLLETDNKKLTKILTTLIENAIKFTNQGEIIITYKLQPNLLKIDIQDTGIGIDNHEKESIFNSFFQSQKSLNSNFGGLGLGLYFAKKYTNLLNGEISFESTKSIGTKFSIEFLNIQVKNKTVSNKVKNITIDRTNNKINLLIAEDGDINYLLLQKLLSKNTKYQFEITRAENGQETIDLYKNNSFDLVFMDIKMPIIDGYEATRVIKKLNSEAIIIAQTAFSRDEDVKNAYLSGCNDFLAKPIDSSRLNDILEKYLD